MAIRVPVPAAPTGHQVREALRYAGQVLTRVRKRRGWSRAEVAARCGHTQDWLGKIEAGHRQPNLDKLLILLHLYALTMDDLFPSNPTSRRAAALAILVTQPVHKLEAAAMLMTVEDTPAPCPAMTALD